MAYVFNKFENALGGRQSGGSSKGELNRLEKNVGTTTPTSGTANQSNSNTSIQSPDQFTKSNFANTNAIINQNLKNQNEGKLDASGAVAGRVTQGAQEQASGISNSMQQKADEYKTTNEQDIAQKYANPGMGAVNSAVVGGDQAAFGKVRDALYRNTDKVQQFDAGTYNPLDASQYLREGDVSGILQRGAGQGYTKGMGALDNLMFKKTGGAAQVQKNVGDLEQQLANQRESYMGDSGLTANAQRLAESTNQGTKDFLNRELTGLKGGIDSDIAQRTAAQRAANQSEYDQKLAAERKRFTDRLAASQYLKQQDPRMYNEAVLPFQNTIDNYIQSSNPDVRESMLTSQDQANQFNRIAELLGLGDRRNVESLVNPSVTSRFDQFNRDYGENFARVDNKYNQKKNELIEGLAQGLSTPNFGRR